MKTLYAVKCEKADNRDNYLGICGLFKNKESAEKACAFWNKSAAPGYRYYMGEITTDLLED